AATSCPCTLHKMPPGTAARGATHTGLRPCGIVLGRDRIVARVVPVAAPLVNIVAHVKKSVTVGTSFSHALRARPFTSIAIQRFRGRVTPRVFEIVVSTPACLFPFSFGGQAISVARGWRQPLAAR